MPQINHHIAEAADEFKLSMINKSSKIKYCKIKIEMAHSLKYLSIHKKFGKEWRLSTYKSLVQSLILLQLVLL